MVEDRIRTLGIRGKHIADQVWTLASYLCISIQLGRKHLNVLTASMYSLLMEKGRVVSRENKFLRVTTLKAGYS